MQLKIFKKFKNEAFVNLVSKMNQSRRNSQKSIRCFLEKSRKWM